MAFKTRRNKDGSISVVVDDTPEELTDSDYAPVRDDNGRVTIVKSTTSKTKEEEEQETVDDRKWFEAGAFEDGYQFGDVVKTLLGSATDLEANIRGGALEIGEKVVDAGAYLVGGAAKLFGGDKFADDVQGFIEKDLYDGEKIAANMSGLATKAILGLLGEDYDDVSIFGEKTDSLAQSGGQLAGTIALQAVGVPWFVTSGVTSFGSATEGAFKEDASYGEAGLYGAISAGAEILTEKLFGGSGLGEKGLINLDGLTKGISNKVVKALADIGVDMAAEGAEEIATSVIDRLGSALYKEENLGNLLLSEEAVDEYIESFIGGAVLGGVANTGKAASSIKTGRDYRTGLVGNEQKVFDAEYNKRVAEEEKDGNKLTKKEKSKIYDEVMNDLEKGYISTDSIEEVLGGADYNSYQDTVKNEDALLKELNELRNMKSGDMTDIQKDRLTELKGMNLTDTTKRDGLKTKLSEGVYGLVKDTKLAESYNERSRRGQTFEADLSGYDTKQAKIVQKAIDSGILNNTRRTHEFVDMVAKISADKGVSFDFANNAKLKETGFAVDGATINGYVTKDGITVNIDSAKSLNSVVGHEIAHVLEGTELYAEMQTAMFEYAKAKGDYQGRFDTLTKLYKDVEGADVDAELTADLVGDYLFTDSDFINNLSTKHRNVFQKIYDELKYLCKVATAGSKEARELEKVKRAFDKAYKESGKTEGTKYSISDKNIKDVSTGYAYGESYYTMSYTQDGKVVGTLEYGEYNGEPNVKMIEVDPEYRRKGIATKLLQELQNKYPDMEIDFGMSTPDGTKLLDSITYDVTDEAVVADRQRLKDLQTELNDLQGKLDVLFDTENLTEAQDNELHELGDRWQEVYETIGKLEKDLRGKKATKTFVKTDTKYSLSNTETDKTYLAAVKRGDTDTVQRMVDEAASEAGYKKLFYHGTASGDFTKFKSHGKPMWITENREYAEIYANGREGTGYAEDKRVMPLYAKMDNVLDLTSIDTSLLLSEEFYRTPSRSDLDSPSEELHKLADLLGEDVFTLADMCRGTTYESIWQLVNTKQFADIARKKGYDTIKENEFGNITYGVLDNTQLKSADAVTYKKNKVIPLSKRFNTENEDIRYSLSDSDGKQLTKEQSEYFKDSKMRDDNGNLKVMYHGSQDAGFHVFDPSMSDDGISLFFVDRNDVATSYSGTSETYAPRVFKSAEDANNFLKEMGFYGGKYGYEVVENDGEFTLFAGDEAIATSDNMAEIYEEFCDYEGVGYGDANYKVYLNLTNPLVVDAKGRPWNKIDAEFSQEIYDKYKSLTAEEKAALADLAEWEDFRIFNSEIQEARGDALASAYAKMGEDCNIYDLFSVAADNFSEEAMRENARGYLKTRDYAQRAKEGGYDGVILKNVIDNGGYSNGDEGASTVAIAFNPEQVKSVANDKPTGDPDIRYSLSSDSKGRKLSGEQSEYFKDSKIVDGNGHLKVMYHGTPNGDFSIFKDGTYFTENKWYADLYQNPGASSISTGKVATNPKTFEVYLDIKKPFDIADAEARKIYINDYIKGGNAVGINPYLSDAEYDKISSIDWTEGEDLRDFLIDNGYDYDGLVLDEGATGGYGDDVKSRGKSYVVFSPEQVKNVDNKTPTSDPDIRYSLTEYTAEEKKAHNDAVLNHFGKTYSWAETGYLLLDGTRLDLSGKHDGAPGGYRTVDHRDITEALGYDYGGGDYSGSLVQFMSEGNIRIIPECNGINLSVKPTQAQEQALSNYISRFRGEVMLDIDDLNGNTVVSVEYPYGTYYSTVLNDIREWFDNGKKPENAGSYSLTKEGSTPKSYGRWNVYGKDISLDKGEVAPTQEDIAKNATTTQGTVSNMEQVEDIAPVDEAPTLRDIYGEEYEPVENAYTVEQEMKALQDEMVAVYEEYNALKNEGKDAEAQPLFDKFLELNERGQELYEKAEVYKAEEQSVADSLTDADAPPEVEAPYYEDDGIIDPFEDRDIQAVGNQKVKAYMYENPEVKPFFQEEATILLGELRNTTKGERFYTETPDGQAGVYGAESYGHWTGTVRQTTSDIEYLLDSLKMSYADIEKGLNAIIEDNGAENIAAAKRIEFILNDRLMNGYQDISGYDIPANQEYRDLIKEKGVTEYNEEAFKRLISEYNANLPRQTEDIAPTFDTARKDHIPGQQSIFEDAPTETAEAETAEAEEPKIAKVLESTPKEQKKGKLATKVRNLVFDKQSVIEDISLKTKNRELMGKADFMLRSESRAQRHIKNKLMPILERVERTGNRQAFEEYAYHLHNIDRMSLEGKAQARIAELEGKFKDLKPEQVKAIAAKEITDKTTERTANTIREAKEYLNALETKNKPVFGDEITADVSREIVKNFEAEHKDARELSEAITEYNNELRQMLVDGGIISQETADLWANMYPHYVPIRRAGKDGAAVKVPLDSMRTGVNAPIARATGGNSDIESLLDVMGSRTEQVYRAVARNNFGVELMHTLDTVTDTQPASVDEVLDSFGNESDELLKKGENGANPTFTVFEDGQRITFDITEELYDALKPTNDVLKADIPIMSFLTKIQRGILTQYNPTFIATNAVKDIQDVLVNSQHATKTYANVPLAVAELIKGKGKWITEYMDNGGEDLTYFDSKKQVFKKKDSAVKKVLGFVPDKIAKANDFVEKIPRLAEYIASRKNGASVEVAMLDAARVTTNFAAGGDLTKFANKNGFTFLNASVQGFNQQVRNVREAKANGLKGVVQLAAKVAIAGLPVMLLNHLLWDDDEEYEELSDYVKDNYYIVAKKEDGTFVRIPKGRTVAVIQNAFEQMDNFITGDDEVDMKRFGELVVNNLAPNNPLENNVIAPIGDVIDNKTWYGEDLVPSRLQDVPAAEQYDETTDSISKWLGEVTNTSPYKWNYVIDQYSGGVGDVVLPYLTPESDGGGVLAPFIDKFTTDSVKKNQNVSDFYNTVDELTKNANSMYATDEDILKSKYINSISTELSKLYQQKREVQSSVDYTDAEKDEFVREIQTQINDMAKESLNTYGNVNIDGVYATVGDLHYRWYEPGEDSTAEAGWQKLTDKQLEKQNEVTSGLGISAGEYWSNKEEYDYAYDSPGKYAVSKAVGGYKAFKTYSSELYDIKADKDEDGKSITGSRKEKVIDYVNNLDVDYGTRLILFKSEYNADDTYNYDIIDYLNNREDISYEDMAAILVEIGFTVDSKGNITWD